MTRNEIMANLEHKLAYLKEKGYRVAGIFLQGSQNYDMAIHDKTYESDIDAKAWIIPPLEDVVYERKKVSYTEILPDNSHIDVKDIRLVPELMRKANVQYVELVNTDYYIVDESILPIIEMRDEISSINKDQLIRTVFGMFLNKKAALRHPYPTLVDKLAKFGYDPKQLHHMLRLLVFAKDFYLNGKTFEEALIPEKAEKEQLIMIKKGIIPNEDCDALVENWRDELFDLKLNVHKIDYPFDEDTYYKLWNIMFNIVLQEIKGDARYVTKTDIVAKD